MISIPRSLLVGLVELANKECSAGSPNHAHEIPGVWDSDNGELAGKQCAECALYDLARKILADTTNADPINHKISVKIPSSKTERTCFEYTVDGHVHSETVCISSVLEYNDIFTRLLSVADKDSLRIGNVSV